MAEEQHAADKQIIGTGRLEAFSDGVMAVIITIMVLELHPPTGRGSADIGALGSLVPKVLIYLLSFTFIGIYWNNHHHLLRATPGIDSNVMWANLHLLFWLSLIPVATAWAGDHLLAPWPAAAYGFVGLMSGIAYYILVRAIIIANKGADIERAIGGDFKGRISLVIYAIGMALASFTLLTPLAPLLSYIAYVGVAVMWFIPDQRLAGR